jgi:hypothetical protein
MREVGGICTWRGGPRWWIGKVARFRCLDDLPSMPHSRPRGHPARRDASRLPGRIVSAIGALLLASGIYGAVAASRDDEQQPPLLAFTIRKQPLATALQEYSQATGVQVLYESSSAVGMVSAGVEGEFTREAALQALLQGTELTVRYTQASSVTLAPVRKSNTDDPPAGPLSMADLTLDTLRVHGAAETRPPELRAYTGIIQGDIQQALTKNEKTRKGSYSVGVKLWISAPRTVQRAELYRRSGDPERDAAISQALEGLVISQAPPANTPQPIVVLITVRPL